MSPRSTLILLPAAWLTLILMTGSVTVSAATPDPEPWRLMAGLSLPEARAIFAAAEPADDFARLGMALSLLGAQPRTDANLDAAEKLLAELAKAADPRVAIRARWLHARVPHLHRQPADWAEAARRYRAVYEAHPEHPLGQRALVRHGVVTLLRSADLDAVRAGVAVFVREAAGITDPEARRQADELLAAVHERRLADPTGTLAHVERILASPVPPREVSRLSLLVQAGELARELGDRPKAARYYRAFLAATQRDNRVYMVQQRLAEVEIQP